MGSDITHLTLGGGEGGGWAVYLIGVCGGILEAVIWQVWHCMVWAAIPIVVFGASLKQAVTIDAGERSE